MQAQQKLFNKIVFTLFEKFPQLFLLKVYLLSQVRPLLPCFSSLLCSVFKVQLRIVPSKLDNVRKEKADHRKFVGMVTNMSP